MLYKKLTVSLCFILFAASLSFAGDWQNVVGDDLVAKFQSALSGNPLRVVVIGGSITQAGQGWIDGWLKKSFPKSLTALKNAGMSGTGSKLGMFRIGRDAISFQPDVVMIEFAVNDGGTPDDTATWALESIIHRLKELPNPPAIFFIQTASENGTNIKRHTRVAEYYGFAQVNLQKKVDDFITKTGGKWKDYFSDAVHPVSPGHAKYSEFIAEELDKYMAKAKVSYKPAPYRLPVPLSRKRLVLDGSLTEFPLAQGWKTESYIPYWYARFFQGILSPKKYPASLSIPVQGTVIGIFYQLSKKDDYGKMLANVNSKGINIISCNHRGGYSYTILEDDLENCQHTLNIAVPESMKGKTGPKLGYILSGGFSEPANNSQKLAPQGEFTSTKMQDLNFSPLTGWKWAGPFGEISKKPSAEEAIKELKKTLPIESAILGRTYEGWKLLPQQKSVIDFQKLTGNGDRGTNYATATIRSDRDRGMLLGISVDYWAKVWINGKLVLTLDKTHGAVATPVIFCAKFKKGDNPIIVKMHAGSKGSSLKIICADKP